MLSDVKKIFQGTPLVVKITRGSCLSERTVEALIHLKELMGLRVCSIPCVVKGPQKAEVSEKIRFEQVSPVETEPLQDEVICWFLETLLSRIKNKEAALIDNESTAWFADRCYSQDKYLLFSVYCEQLEIIPGSENAVLKESFGERKIALADKDENFVQTLYKTFPEGGLCVSQVTTDQQHQVKPLLIDFGEHDPRNDRKWQRIIANAYWQTCWATGAIRGNRGDTESVVFFPLSWKEESTFFQRVEPDKYITSRRFYQFYLLHNGVRQGAVSYDPQKEKFIISEECSFQQALEKILEKKGFCDLFYGQNQDRKQPFVLKRAVPVMGSHLLSKVIVEKLGKYSQPESLPCAGSNSVFFLNFPEEYPLYYTAMNAPVGLLAIDGRIIQPALLKRGCMYYSDGEPRIDIFSLENMEITLPDGSQWRCEKETEPGAFIFSSDNGAQCLVYSPFRMTQHAATPAGSGTEMTVVGDHIVEINGKKGNPVPQNGLVMSFSEESPDWSAFPHFCVRYRVINNGKLVPVENAISCGPVLLNNSKIIGEEYFNVAKQLNNELPENFLPYQKDAGYNPLVPTRFPHFVNQVRAPRTFLGLKEKQVCLIVVDGRSTEKHSIGMTLQEEAGYLAVLGCTEGLNLDGGGSSVLWVRNQAGTDGKIINRPSDKGNQERLMPVPVIIE